MKKLIILSALGLSLTCNAFASNWQSLFNGKDLSGWKKLGGDATYTVKNGAIVGKSIMGTPNTFLTTTKNYGDFIFEAEVKIDSGLNSGIQFRSQSKASFNQGQVHGYQVEIDSSERKWSGGIYEEGKRGWIYTVTRNQTCRDAFKLNDWNHYRVEAINNRIRTWVNQVACTDILDNEKGFKSGFIALQVHRIKDQNLSGKTVSMRKPRILTKNLADNQWDSPSAQQINYMLNQLSNKQKNEGWKLLWDGKTFNGWKGTKMEGFPQQGWGVEDNSLVIYASPGTSVRNGGDIVTLESFSEFELELDFKITDGANSGIKYFVDPNRLKKQGSATGLEFQILHDEKHPDAKKGHQGNRTMGSLYDLIPATNLSEITRSKKRVNPVGSWNRARIVVKNGHVEHWLNNIKVVEYPRGSQIFKALVQHSKYAKWPNFGEWQQGPIVLQDHGDEVRFQSIKIRDLSK